MIRKSFPLRTLCFLALTAALAAPSAHAARLVYSGVLEVDGQPANGRHDVRVTAYASADGAVPKASPVEFHAVEVKDGRFEVALDLPGEAREAWVDLAVRPTGTGAFVPLLGRSKAALAPEAIGQCWSSTGDSGSNPSTNFLGTTDAQPLVLRTQSTRSLRLEPSSVLQSGNPITANVIAGSAVNSTLQGVRGATISGGGANPTGDPDFNTVASNFVSDHYGAIGGGFSNVAGDQLGSNADAAYATVSGGRNSTAASLGSTVSGGAENLALGSHAAVGGGFRNRTTQSEATIAGGDRNSANGVASAVAGGGANDARGERSFVAGGSFNCAGADFSFAGGRQAKVRPPADPNQSNPNNACSGLGTYPGGNGDVGSFVWADSRNAAFVTSGPDQFLVRADGGLFFNTNIPVANADDVTFRARQNSGDADMDLRLLTRTGKSVSMYVSDSNGGLFIGVPNLTAASNRLTVTGGTVGNASLSNGGTWTNASSRAFKEGFDAIDPLEVLNRLLALPITTWEYTGSAEGLHLGPVAEDFKAAFGLAGDGRSIATVDADGVAMAAIQGLNHKLEAERDALKAENDELRARLDRLEAILIGKE
jgi:trimeric autotransporter adhesin